MAAAVRTRSVYTPVSVEDTGQEGLLRANSVTSVTKPKRSLSVWTFSLVVIGLCVLFLCGFLLGFYVRESQSPSNDDVVFNCENVGKDDKNKVSLTTLHDDMMYRIRGDKVEEFLQ
jgi:hypothetical protein